MPTITLTDAYDVKLKTLGEPFVDTRESVIERLIDEELKRRGTTVTGNGHAGPVGDNRRRLNPDSPDGLAFTRLLSATIDRRQLNRPKWNGVMDHLHVMAVQRLGFDEVNRISGAQLRQGRYDDNGYKYISEADFSIQGVDSNLAWAHSLRLARALGVPIRLIVEWRDVDGAAHPGETAVLEWTPTPN